MLPVPKFLFSEVPDGPRPGRYVVHTIFPRCVGKVSAREDGKVRVYVVDAWDVMTEEEKQQMGLQMKNWYYFKYCHGKIL